MPSKTRGRKATRNAPQPQHFGYAPYMYDLGQPEVRKGDLNVVSRIFWMCHKNRVELAPLASFGLLLSTSVVMYKSHNPAVGLILAGTITGGTWYLAPKKWDRDVERWYARIVATAASLWLIAACIVGPLNAVVFWALLLGTTAAAIPWYTHKLVRPHDDSLLIEWAEKWVAIRDRLGLHGSRIVEAKGSDDYAELTLQLVKGVQTYGDVQPLEERIAGALDLPKRAIKIRDMRKTNASRVKLVYTKVSVIDSIIRWNDIEQMAGRSVNKPLILGRQETGDWRKVDPKGHWMIVGQTRAGKSQMLHNILAQLTGSEDAIVFFIDLKNGSSAIRWGASVDWVATNMSEAITMMGAVNGMINARAADADFSNVDGDQLAPTKKCPAVYIVFDECAEGLGPGGSEKRELTEAMESVARRGAAMGFYLILAGQDGSLETYGSERLRGMLTRRLCFRVAKQDNAQYVLKSWSTLDVCTLEDGQFYYHEREDDVVPIRGPHMTPNDDRQLPQKLAERNSAIRPTLDSATAAGGGKAYATRFERYEPRFRKVALGAVLAAAPEAPTVQEDKVPTPSSNNAAEEMVRQLEQEAGLGEGQVISFEDMKRVSNRIDLAKEVQDTRDMLCLLLVNAPESGVKLKSLYESLNVSSSWVSDRLTALKRSGLTENPSHGQWKAAPTASAQELRDAIDAWESGRRQLAAV